MSQTNYIPSITDPHVSVNFGPYGSGAGSPEGVVTGYPGYLYVDTGTGNFYAFNGVSGANTGWVLESGGGGGSGGLSGTGSPEGAHAASPGATYFQTNTESFWVKKTGTGNTGWIELIA